MATWQLETAYKKSSNERQIWYKDDKMIIREEGYRWSTFTVESDDIPLAQDELQNEDNYYELGSVDNGENWEMQEMIDGCWADTEAGRNCTDEDLAAFEEAWEENYYEGVEALGWSHDDTEYFMTGPLKLTNLDTGVEYSGLIDPTTIVHTIELPSAEVLPALSPIINEKAKWPFATAPVVEVQEPELTDWFPASINPAYIGVYEILTKESINWPYPNKGLWDGKKWNFLDHTVEEWRGLAQDPNKE